MKRSMEELVLLARKGDQEAISELYEQTYNSVYQSVRAIMKDEEEALDVVQDSYMKGFQNLDKLETPEKYQAWMKQIAANQARDYLRKKRPVLFSERVNQEGEELDLQQPDACLEHMPDEVIDRQETTRLMNLKQSGWTWQPRRDSPDMYEADTGYFHKTICFAYPVQITDEQDNQNSNN